jgi:excisionase family DNA binding protein
MTLLSLRAAAKLLHCDPRTLKDAIRTGCPAVRLGKRWKIEKHELETWARGRHYFLSRGTALHIAKPTDVPQVGTVEVTHG